jgi:hypothetical protein
MDFWIVDADLPADRLDRKGSKSAGSFEKPLAAFGGGGRCDTGEFRQLDRAGGCAVISSPEEFVGEPDCDFLRRRHGVPRRRLSQLAILRSGFDSVV